MAMLPDHYADAKVKEHFSNALTLFLAASYAYYIQDDPILNDFYYDRLAQRLDEKWDVLQHRFKHLIDPATLRTGSAYYIAEDSYPPQIVDLAHSYRLIAKYLEQQRSKNF